MTNKVGFHYKSSTVLLYHALSDHSLSTLEDKLVLKWRKYVQFKVHIYYAYVSILLIYVISTRQPLRTVGVLFLPKVMGRRASRRAGRWGGGKNLSRLYLRNCKV